MISPNLFERIRYEMDEMCRPKTESILTGGPQDYANYRESVGYLHAMNDFIDMLERLKEES